MRQAQILDFICEHVEKKGYPPTIREIMSTIGTASTNGAREHLEALRNKGFIQIERMKSRGITVLKTAAGKKGRVVQLRAQIAALQAELADLEAQSCD